MHSLNTSPFPSTWNCQCCITAQVLDLKPFWLWAVQAGAFPTAWLALCSLEAMLTGGISVASLGRGSKSSEIKEGVRSSGSSTKAFKYHHGLHKIPKSQHFGFLPQGKTVAVSVYWSFYFSPTPLTHPPRFCLAHSCLSRLQKSTREECRRCGLYMKCLVAQLGGKTHVSSSSALSSTAKGHSDNGGGLVMSCEEMNIVLNYSHGSMK